MNINTARIKYVIAREGLIIIVIAILAGIVTYVDSWKNNQIFEYEQLAEKVELVKKDENKSGAKGSYFTTLGIYIQFPKGVSIETAKKVLERDYPKIKDADWIIWDKNDNIDIDDKYDLKGNKLFVGIPWNVNTSDIPALLIFFTYPGYLLLRFIAWAIRTVRSRKAFESIT